MTLKKPHTLRTLDQNEAPDVDDNFENLYRNKLESRYYYAPSSTATVLAPFQSMETGAAGFSANGSATVLKNFPLKDTIGTITYAQCMAQHSSVLAMLVDVTNSSISIEARSVSGTAALSAVTTSSFTVRWQVINSSP